MRLSNLNDRLALVANLGVLAGILFLGIEINQSNRIAIGTAEYEVLSEINIANRLILTDESVRNLIDKLVNSNDELSYSEQQQAIAYAYNWYAAWEGIQQAYIQGLISERLLNSTLADIEAIAGGTPRMKFAWQVILARGYEPKMVLQKLEEVVSNLN